MAEASKTEAVSRWQCIRSIKENIPEDMPLFMRIDAHDDYLEGGLTIEEVIEFCKLAKEAGVDVLDISRGNILSAGLKYEVPPIDIPKAFNIENAAKIRKGNRNAYGGGRTYQYPGAGRAYP